MIQLSVISPPSSFISSMTSRNWPKEWTLEIARTVLWELAVQTERVCVCVGHRFKAHTHTNMRCVWGNMQCTNTLPLAKKKKSLCPKQTHSPVPFACDICVCEERRCRVGGGEGRGATDNTFFYRCGHSGHCSLRLVNLHLFCITTADDVFII